ncbi:hypothetical protein B0O99DRAFT_696152 [Bisporella sp. PMI_857]|nr:hypothetical protein B0O99DRAFT_696152 [Bisporella sp. PMI_857]
MANARQARNILGEIIRESCLDLGRYREIYKKVHRNLEFSEQETRMAALVGQHLTELGSTKVIANIGGTSVVGALQNGKGPVVLVRFELDALPMEEHARLPSSR